MKIPLEEAGSFHVEVQKDGQTDMTKLKIAFFAIFRKRPKTYRIFINPHSYWCEGYSYVDFM